MLMRKNSRAKRRVVSRKKRQLKKRRYFSLSRLPGIVSTTARNVISRKKRGVERVEGREY